VNPGASRHALLLRADASAEIGTGHVMRCLALAQAWMADGGTAVFLVHSCPYALVARLRGEGCHVVQLGAEPGTAADAAETAAAAAHHGAEWVAVDGYTFDAHYQDSLIESGCRLLFIDDYGHADRYPADIVLNQNLYASASMYPARSSGTRLLLGTKYALLRQELLGHRTDAARSPDSLHVLVTLGGGDPDNATATVLDALAGLPGGLRVSVCIGGANPHIDQLRDIAAHADHDIAFLRNVANMADLMVQADIAVSAGGSTCWELCYFGVPTLIVVIADNQRPIAAALADAGAGVSLGWHADLPAAGIAAQFHSLALDRERRMRMAAAGRRIVDGHGAARVAAVLRQAEGKACASFAL
jgi:UDP-2,4-diacetamido-2,4,6-trideoxy-beta-L-altropyranose hydrolase